MAEGRYWRERAHLLYYDYVSTLVRVFARDARSLLDVGTSDARYLEEFDWIPRKVALDKRTSVYSSPSVEGVAADFFTYEPQEKFDIVTCFQVLEHVPDAGRFARKLFDVGRNVMISVPYKWRPGDCKWHVHDPVDSEKLMQWTGREPDYSIVVREASATRCAERLIAFYGDPGVSLKILDATLPNLRELEAEHRIAALERELAEARAEAERYRGSLSWRVTAPLRAISARLPRRPAGPA